MKAVQHLADFFNRNGVLRVPDTDRRKLDGRKSHKGYEIRLIAMNETEIGQIERALKVLGLQPGCHFAKSNRTVIPIYGRDQVLEFITRTKVEIPDLPETLRS